VIVNTLYYGRRKAFKQSYQRGYFQRGRAHERGLLSLLLVGHYASYEALTLKVYVSVVV
jgi:hypothetical protein